MEDKDQSPQDNNQENSDDKQGVFLNPDFFINKVNLQEQIKKESKKSEKRDKIILVIVIWIFIVSLANLVINIIK